jgi:hypothetical protein
MWCLPTGAERDRNGDLAYHFGQVGPEQTEDGASDPGFDRRQRHTDRDAHVQAVVTDRPHGADLRQFLEASRVTCHSGTARFAG